ncbi:MAG TPA: prepilin-type N-terminal cleavage/methylation domain-containing protein [Gemmatimonadales bacterium]|nr:prepilin-type N-terminal cleavage/methylation domain-containing protein [Gemmatimonadales bacterium]
MTNRQGFTVVEVLVAIMVLGVGILALVGSSALVSRMIGEGKRATYAAQIAQRRIEAFRREAALTANCGSLAAATGTASTDRITEQWAITVGNDSRNITVRAIYPNGRGNDTVQLTTIVGCY